MCFIFIVVHQMGLKKQEATPASGGSRACGCGAGLGACFPSPHRPQPRERAREEGEKQKEEVRVMKRRWQNPQENKKLSEFVK